MSGRIQAQFWQLLLTLIKLIQRLCPPRLSLRYVDKTSAESVPPITSMPIRTSASRLFRRRQKRWLAAGQAFDRLNLGDNVYFPKFLIGMATSLVVVACWTYTQTGSAWVSLAWTFAAALLLQAGYFMAILIMIFGRRILQIRSPISRSSRIGLITSGKLPRSRARPDLER